MVRTTKQQERAQKAFDCISSVREDNDAYCQFAKKFPALVHTCGLAQAVAFFQSKEGTAYLDDLAKVMGKKDNEEIGNLSRTVDLLEYQHLTREAIESATWIKRYSEAILDKYIKKANPEMR
jgi:CRISPR-associated protein Cmr5